MNTTHTWIALSDGGYRCDICGICSCHWPKTAAKDCGGERLIGPEPVDMPPGGSA